MAKQATIKVQSVGQAFGCEAHVMQGRKVLHTTRVCPYGMRGVAYELAESWAAAQGMTVL